MAGIGVATVRRFENGRDIDRANLDALRAVLEAEGAILVDAGNVVKGRKVDVGVLLPPRSELPASTRARLAALDKTPEEASTDLAPDRAGKVGRRSRVAYVAPEEDGR